MVPHEKNQEKHRPEKIDVLSDRGCVLGEEPERTREDPEDVSVGKMIGK